MAGSGNPQARPATATPVPDGGVSTTIPKLRLSPWGAPCDRGCGPQKLNLVLLTAISFAGCDRAWIHFDSCCSLSRWMNQRTSELIALDWDDIDWINERVYVTRSLTQGMKEPEESTKTSAGRRIVKLLPPALQALRQ